MARNKKSPIPSPGGDAPTSSVPARSDIGENSASELIEAPQPRAASKKEPLGAHDFPDGGGSGGAERFSRARLKGRRGGPR